MKAKRFLLLSLIPFMLSACTLGIGVPTNNGTSSSGTGGGTGGSTGGGGNTGGNTGGGGTGGNTGGDSGGGTGGGTGGNTDKTSGSFTLLIYMCGSDLESGSAYADAGYEYQDWYKNGSGLATEDIAEILSVKNQPKDVNIVIQTGGAKKWRTVEHNYGISATKTQRWHVKDGNLVKDLELNKANMGLSSTLESFLTWGLQTYPADKTGLILWNHGGAMRGVCYDENYSDDSLLNSEVSLAVKNSLETVKRTDKLEFIGYDACLMAVQDVAEFNSKYFNYMIASEESESGYGWDYDNWIDDLYAKKSTLEVLKATCDSFIESNNVDEYENYSTKYNDQTLSVLDLSKMDAYKTAWEEFSSAIISKSPSKNTIKSTFNKAKRYAVDEDRSEDYFAIYDAKDVINKVKNTSTVNPGNDIIQKVSDAFSQLVVYNKKGAKAGNSNGLACYYAATSDAAKKSVYVSKETNFSSWISFNTTFGN